MRQETFELIPGIELSADIVQLTRQHKGFVRVSFYGHLHEIQHIYINSGSSEIESHASLTIMAHYKIEEKEVVVRSHANSTETLLTGFKQKLIETFAVAEISDTTFNLVAT